MAEAAAEGAGTGIAYAARSDVGRVRSGNEDRWLARPPLFVVADGMGGHAAGEVAAQLAVDAFGALSEARVAPFDAGVLAGAILGADDAIRRRASSDPAADGMGTTCTALAIEGTTGFLAHVGDSRAYLLRAGRLTQLTEDHTLVAALVRDGVLTTDAAATDDRRHVILRALGVGEAASVDRLEVELRPGDRLLLCSDGLTGHLDGPALAEALGSGTPADAADRLVGLALAAGGEDNVTVVVVDPASSPAAAPVAAPVAAPPPGEATASDAAPGRRRRRSALVATIGVLALAVVLALALLVATGFLGSSAPTPAPSVSPSIAPSPSSLPSPSTGPSVAPSSLPPASVSASPSSTPSVSPSPTASSA